MGGALRTTAQPADAARLHVIGVPGLVMLPYREGPRV
jgi:hypothetical protein